jgi:hypothetical protein
LCSNPGRDESLKREQFARRQHGSQRRAAELRGERQMSSSLIAAAILAVAIGIAHSWLGERFIIVRLLRRDNLPALFGDDTFTGHTLRFAWHLTTVAWWGLAAILGLLAGALPAIPVGQGVLLVIGLTFLASAVLAVVLTRARHLSWPVFLAIAILCAVAAT